MRHRPCDGRLRVRAGRLRGWVAALPAACRRLSPAVLLGLAGCVVNPARQAAEALDRARRLDAQVESAPRPDEVARQRDQALAEAERLHRKLLAASPELPEAHLGLAEIAWRGNHDLATAFREVSWVVEHLGGSTSTELARRRSSGRTGAQVLAEAYAARASYLISRYTDPALGGAAVGLPLPAGPLAQAEADVGCAIALDPRPDYTLLRDSLTRLRRTTPDQAPQPLDPGSLGSRPAAE